MASEELLEGVFNIVREHYRGMMNRDVPVRSWRTPMELATILNVSVEDEGVDTDTLLNTINTYLSECVKTQHPHFLQPLWGGLSEAGLAGEIATVLSNTSIYTWELAPAATVIEMEMVATLGRLAGWDQTDGTFTSGGSNSNLLALLLARDRLFPNAINDGIDGTKLAIFVSAESHYSLLMSAHVLGIGRNGVIAIETDDVGRMKPDVLQTAIADTRAGGRVPFCVVATTGTTVRGAFDPIDALADVCQDEELWLHVDAALGAPCLFSPKYKHLMGGIERADSLTWDPHKLMGVPLTCSALLTPHLGALGNTCSYIKSAHYLFHEPGEEYDLGRKSLQCGRRVDALKLWIEWKACGNSGWRDRIENHVDLAIELENLVLENPNLELVCERSFTNVCLRYRGALQNEQDLNLFNDTLRQKMVHEGEFMVSLTKVEGKTVLRPVICNPAIDSESLKRFVDKIIQIASTMN
mgnify:CR=1 FL=1